MVRAFTNSWGRGGFAEFDAEFKFAKIQNSHLWVEGGGGGSQNLMLKSKIPICVCVWGGGGREGGGSWNLMPSSNLLKSKIPILLGGGGGVGGTNFPTFDAESKFAEKKFFFAKNWNGFVLGFEYRVVRYTKYSEPQ